jgi:hypothetical protein
MRGRYFKFQVNHYARGALDPEDCFVLVPGRDPAAVAALRAYARVTGDSLLASELVSWADQIEGAETPEPFALVTERIHQWTVILTREVNAGRMAVETALQRIAGHAADFVAELEEK